MQVEPYERRSPVERRNRRIWYSEVASLLPAALLIVTLVVASIARSVPTPTLAPRSSDGLAPVVDSGWIAITTVIPWLLLFAFLAGYAIVAYALWRAVRRFARPSRGYIPVPEGQFAASSSETHPPNRWRDANMIFIGGVFVLAVLLFVLWATHGLYEYRWAVDGDEVTRLINQDGWHVVPDQPSSNYLRRSRLFTMPVRPMPPSRSSPSSSPLPTQDGG